MKVWTDIKLDNKSHRTRQLYRKINEMKKRYTGQYKFIRSKGKYLITKKLEIAECWKVVEKKKCWVVITQ